MYPLLCKKCLFFFKLFNTLEQRQQFSLCGRMCGFLVMRQYTLWTVMKVNWSPIIYQKTTKRKTETHSKGNTHLRTQVWFRKPSSHCGSRSRQTETAGSVSGSGRNISQFPLRNPGSIRSITRLVTHMNALWAKSEFPVSKISSLSR